MHPENMFDIVVTLDVFVIEMVWLNELQFKNIWYVVFNAVEVVNVNGFDPRSLVSPLLNIVHPENMLSILVTFDTLEIETVWLNALQLKKIFERLVNGKKDVIDQLFNPSLIMLPLLNIGQS